jgi:UDPglucose--hexose-1-phosphate uridylyltransferase
MPGFAAGEGAPRRLDPLLGEWVLVSPHRSLRPWQGQVEPAEPEHRPSHDPGCYLCPGNRRAGGATNPDYEGVFVFDNDYPALTAGGPGVARRESGLLVAEAETGVCRVVCFSPRHDLSLGEMGWGSVRQVVDAWADQHADLGGRADIGHVQIFENRGQMMGCSNPHPHGQIWAQRSVPTRVARERVTQREHHLARGSTLLGDYLAQELDLGERIVFEQGSFVALVPFWATWPFESLLLPRRPVPDLLALEEAERDDLAKAMREIARRYDALFRAPFPYSSGLHQAPTDGAPHPEWHLHVHYYPPLLRSATVRKFMVGYEMLGETQRDLTPEESAARLREVAGEQNARGA